MPRVWLAIVLAWLMSALYVKRLHDQDMPGWLIAVPGIALLASVLNISGFHFVFWFCIIADGVGAGTPGDNHFGPSPFRSSKRDASL
jgi:uncharacterized membrane protein YhaH (DUF805 family)